MTNRFLRRLYYEKESIEIGNNNSPWVVDCRYLRLCYRPSRPCRCRCAQFIEQHTTGKVYIAWSDAYEDGDGFVVTGVLRRRDTVGLPIKTHVDITIESPDGTIIDESRSSDVHVPRRITGRGQSFRRFKVWFPNIPGEGSKVSIVTHSGSHNNTENNGNS